MSTIPKVTTIAAPDDLSSKLAASDDTLFYFGASHFHRTTDCKTFTRSELVEYTSAGAVLASGADVWVGGHSGLQRSTNGGQTFKPIALSAVAAKLVQGYGGGLHGIGKDGEGALWAGGSDGLLLSGDDAKLTIIKGLAKEAVTCVIAGGHGGAAIIATNRGRVYLGTKRKVTKAKLETKGPIYGACVTSRGTVVVVGDKTPLGPGRMEAIGVAFRSEDGGKSFKPAKVPKVGPLWSIASLPDGRVVVGGENGSLLLSNDDGASFVALPHTVKSSHAFHSAVRFGDAVYASGPAKLFVRIA